MPTTKPILGLNFYDEGISNIVEDYLTRKGYSFQKVSGEKIEQSLKNPDKYLCAILGGLRTNPKRDSCEGGLGLVSKLKGIGLNTLVLSGADDYTLNKYKEKLGSDGVSFLRKPFALNSLKKYVENICINQGE